MSLFIAALNSGSNANCYYIGNRNEAILVDAGLSCFEIEVRFKRLKLNILKVEAIFISHEHTDHIKGIALLSKKYQIPVYITSSTLKNCKIKLEESLIHSFITDSEIIFGDLHILPFSKSHDAIDPHSFIVSSGKVSVGVITDVGYACIQVIKHFKQCDAVFLESNYCEEMLENGSYPNSLKQRITSKVGHLSNGCSILTHL